VTRSDDPRDDYDDLPPDRRPRSNPAVTIILILAGLVVALVVVCGGAVALFWVRPAAPPAPPAAAVVAVDEGPNAEATRRIYGRDDFKAEVLGETRDTVRKRLGAPSKGVEMGPPEVWHYAGVTRDPDTGRIDRDAAVVFENGVVTEIRFTPAAENPDGQ
jgi:hypothetical protein